MEGCSKIRLIIVRASHQDIHELYQQQYFKCLSLVFRCLHNLNVPYFFTQNPTLTNHYFYAFAFRILHLNVKNVYQIQLQA